MEVSIVLDCAILRSHANPPSQVKGIGVDDGDILPFLCSPLSPLIGLALRDKDVPYRQRKRACQKVITRTSECYAALSSLVIVCASQERVSMEKVMTMARTLWPGRNLVQRTQEAAVSQTGDEYVGTNWTGVQATLDIIVGLAIDSYHLSVAEYQVLDLQRYPTWEGHVSQWSRVDVWRRKRAYDAENSQGGMDPCTVLQCSDCTAALGSDSVSCEKADSTHVYDAVDALVTFTSGMLLGLTGIQDAQAACGACTCL